MRFVVIVVLTVVLLLASVPPVPARPPSPSPSLSSPALAAIAFGLAVSAGALGGALLVLTRRRRRDTDDPAAAERDGDPLSDSAAQEAPGAVGAQHRRPRGTPPRGMPEIGTRAGPLPLPPGTRAGWPGPWSGGRTRRSASGRYRVVPRGTGAMPDGGQVPVPRPRAGHDPSTTGHPSTGRSHTQTQAGRPSGGGPSAQTPVPPGDGAGPSAEPGEVPSPRTPGERYVTLRTRRYPGPS